MRISCLVKDIIIKEAKIIFGANTKVFLFGSRIDDDKKGGDIDLLILADNSNHENLFQTKIKYLRAVKNQIGEQKIDVIIPQHSSETIVKTALQTGIELCLKEN